VIPRYIDPEDQGSRDLADALLAIFERSVGQPRERLDAELKDFLGTGTAFLLHRGLAKLLRDRCTFEQVSAREPEEIRQKVFEAAAAQRRDSPTFERGSLLAQAAEALEISPEEAEEGLYADLKERQILTTFNGLKPDLLLHRYNSALAQAVLLRATEVEIEILGQPVRRTRALFRKIKFFQLLHRVQPIPGGKKAGSKKKGGFRIILDGPLSLFQASTRYGLQMASFLPTLLHFDGWTLNARLLWGRRRQARRFRLSPETGLRPFTRLTGQWQPEELTFLPQQFAKLKGPWTISRDADVIPLGGQGLLVPDYAFENEETGRKIFMEVVGFWNKGSLQSRLDLIRRHGPSLSSKTDLILAVSRALAADPEALEDLPTEVYLFRTAPVARDVRRLLEEMSSTVAPEAAS